MSDKAVMGYLINDNENSLLSSSKKIFRNLFDGVCAYHQRNIQITKTSVFIAKEIATYKVNKKLTTMNATGSKESGFVYEIEWWDKKYKHNLESASQTYSDDKMYIYKCSNFEYNAHF